MSGTQCNHRFTARYGEKSCPACAYEALQFMLTRHGICPICEQTYSKKPDGWHCLNPECKFQMISHAQELHREKRTQPHEVMRHGGKWLAATREYLKRNVNGGDTCTWGGEARLPITVKQIEELAAHAVSAALNNERNKRNEQHFNHRICQRLGCRVSDCTTWHRSPCLSI